MSLWQKFNSFQEKLNRIKKFKVGLFFKNFDVQNIEQVGNLKNKGKTFFTVHDMITQCQLVINMSEGRGREREEKERKGGEREKEGKEKREKKRAGNVNGGEEKENLKGHSTHP